MTAWEAVRAFNKVQLDPHLSQYYLPTTPNTYQQIRELMDVWERNPSTLTCFIANKQWLERVLKHNREQYSSPLGVDRFFIPISTVLEKYMYGFIRITFSLDPEHTSDFQRVYIQAEISYGRTIGIEKHVMAAALSTCIEGITELLKRRFHPDQPQYILTVIHAIVSDQNPNSRNVLKACGFEKIETEKKTEAPIRIGGQNEHWELRIN